MYVLTFTICEVVLVFNSEKVSKAFSIRQNKKTRSLWPELLKLYGREIIEREPGSEAAGMTSMRAKYTWCKPLLAFDKEGRD
jgi:hypothetical protein